MERAVSADWLQARLFGPAEALGVRVPPATLEPLAQFASLVLDWGARINLTGARSREALADEHLADALALVPHLPPGPFSLVDVGSGAGLPGIPLALIRPDAAAVLLEPARKKHAFLAHALRTLGLTGRVAARAERLQAHLEGGGQGAYDVAVSRATWPAGEWLALGRPLVRAGGLLLGVEGRASKGLPRGAERHPYRLQGRARAVVFRRV